MDLSKVTTQGLYREIDIANAYGATILSPPEHATAKGLSRAAVRRRAARKELKRRTAGVVLQEGEPVPPWSPTVWVLESEDGEVIAFDCKSSAMESPLLEGRTLVAHAGY